MEAFLLRSRAMSFFSKEEGTQVTYFHMYVSFLLRLLTRKMTLWFDCGDKQVKSGKCRGVCCGVVWLTDTQTAVNRDRYVWYELDIFLQIFVIKSLVVNPKRWPKLTVRHVHWWLIWRKYWQCFWTTFWQCDCCYDPRLKANQAEHDIRWQIIHWPMWHFF